MAKKIDRKLNDIDIVEKEFGDFLENGGEIGGTITFPKGIARQISQKIGLRSKDYTQRSGISNYNGYPTWSAIIEDPDDDNNTNGLLFMLGSGSGDAYNDNYLRPLKMGYAQKNNIGSENVPWDDIFLKGVSKGTNGYTKLPNGMILQWGTFTVDGTKGGTATFPISFTKGTIPVVNFSVQTGNISWVGKNVSAHIGTINHTAFNVFTSDLLVINWTAIGY